MPTWTWTPLTTTIAWSDDLGDYHICCTVHEELPNRFTAVVEENGAEIFRASVFAPSLQFSLPWALALRLRFKDRIDDAYETELNRLSQLRPGLDQDDLGA